MFETRDAKFKRIANIVRKLHIDKPLFYIYIYIYERIRPSHLMIEEGIYYKNNEERIKFIVDHLEDEYSILTYKTCLEYRTTRRKYMNSVKRSDSEQYFSPDVINLENESFVDCGAYTGDTFQEFISRCKGKFENYYAFEPDKNNFMMLKSNTQKYDKQKISLYNLGCSNVKDSLQFEGSDSNGNPGAKISEKGDTIIDVDRIDDVLQGKRITFIKMDIEGEETKALEGANSIIKSQRPKLAICIYHSHEDMVNIPYQLMNELKNYKFYIRHYNIDKIETVFYAIPSNADNERLI